jgi:hypothetical protein
MKLAILVPASHAADARVGSRTAIGDVIQFGDAHGLRACPAVAEMTVLHRVDVVREPLQGVSANGCTQ